MSDRDTYEPGVPSAVTTMQPDPRAAAAFYSAVFGWQLDERDAYVVGRKRGRDAASVAPLPPGVEPAPDPAGVTSVRVADVDATAEQARAAGGSVLFGPADVPTGRMAVIADPAGAALAITAAERGAQVVNEPGAWAMSSLSSPDPEAAAAFYGALFGWTTETFSTGEFSATMFRLPGYVGGEPGQPVSREVVATMAPGETAGWSVDFWVDDVDAAAAKAAELGGTAIVAPFDMPLGRSAVLADPAGASFSVTKVAGAG